MKIYNTLTDKLEEFKPLNSNEITMYVCGPTIYNYAHIGNVRPVIFFDTVYRYFKYLGYNVKYASNFTDVDDKIIKAAMELKITEKELTEKFIEIYLDDVRSLNCLEIDYRPKVTENMEHIINFIKLLLENGFAYQKDGDVYFRVSKVDEYGSLSNQEVENLISGARIEVDNNKENPLDFVLWKKTDTGIKWKSPFGDGRPGWHTECVVMIKSIFNGKIDIHGGGGDLKFPHHENEIAQSIAVDNHKIANYWIHNGLININGIKMSKSLNNYILAKDLVAKYGANVTRLAILKNHYRLPLNITDKLFEECQTIDNKISNVLKQVNLYLFLNDLYVSSNINKNEFEIYMDDDFNTPNVITLLLDYVKQLNLGIRHQENNVPDLYSKILAINFVLGLNYKVEKISTDIKDIYHKWEQARVEKDFLNADKYRKILIERGII